MPASAFQVRWRLPTSPRTRYRWLSPERGSKRRDSVTKDIARQGITSGRRLIVGIERPGVNVKLQGLLNSADGARTTEF